MCLSLSSLFLILLWLLSAKNIQRRNSPIPVISQQKENEYPWTLGIGTENQMTLLKGIMYVAIFQYRCILATDEWI